MIYSDHNFRLYKKLLALTTLALCAVPAGTFAQDTSTVQLLKRNASSFAIDGNSNGQDGQNVFLGVENDNTSSQQWNEINRGNGYYSYQKNGTNYCLDGGNGGANGQNVYLWVCSTNNHNQHWLKVNAAQSSYRLQKRNAPNYSIDGNRGGANGQNIYLWQSDNGNQNQHWIFNALQTGGNQNNAPDSVILPGRIQAEDFHTHNGIQIEASGDTGAGEHVGYIRSGHYTEYQVNVPNSGSYSIAARVASGKSGGTINVLSNGNSIGSISVPGTGGWNSFRTVSSNIDLGAGNQTLRLSFTGNSGFLFNINWLEIGDFSEPQAQAQPQRPATPSSNDWNVSTLSELRNAIRRNNQDIVMRPGNYNLSTLNSGSRDLVVSGSNNTINLSGVYVEVPVGSTATDPYLRITGSDNILIGGTFEDTYFNGATRITDFVTYNNDRDNLAYGLRGDPVMAINGDDNVVDGLKITVRGSFPFGYGSNFGIGSNNSFGLSKRCGIFINGDSNTIQNAEVQQHAFCHGIFMQEPADNTTIRNTLVEGLVRPTNDMLAEGRGSLPFRADYRTADGDPIPRNEVHSLAEDGIRAYSRSGSVTVENSTVRRMRGGIRLYLASRATVRNSRAIDSGNTNFNMPRGGTITNSSGNFTYAPISDFRLSRSNQNLELTILPSPNAVGSHNIADIQGNNHDIVFHRANGPIDSDEDRAIVVYGNDSTIRNETEYRIILNSGTRGNTIISAGDVRDNGSNSVRRIDLEL